MYTRFRPSVEENTMFQLLGRILIWLWFSLLLMSLIAICDEYGEYIRFQKKWSISWTVEHTSTKVI